MKEQNLNICQVSLAGNIPIIRENYKEFVKFYKNVSFYIICPKKEKKLFRQKLNLNNLVVVDEENILKFKKFERLSLKFLKDKKYIKLIKPRLKWYYQQVLKVTFLIDFVNKYKNKIVIWDADTLILKKINFFEKNISISYGTTSEYHKAYYDTNRIILKKLPKYFISCLAQFISISETENKYLQKNISKFIKKRKKTSEWITEVIFTAISKAHQNYNGSMFSEYELIGQCNLIYKNKKQKLISGLRENISGKLNNMQKKIVRLLGYKYVAYEHTHNNKFSKNMLKRNQDWYLFLKILINKTSNKFFRGIKHNFLKRIN